MIEVRCPKNSQHEFFRFKDGLSHYCYLPGNSSLKDFKCTGQHSTNLWSPDPCGLTPALLSKRSLWIVSKINFLMRKSLKYLRSKLPFQQEIINEIK